MQVGDAFESAIRAIGANKLRSFLTMLGVVIGVGSVIAMIGIGEGTRQKSIEQLEIRGSNMISVMPDWGRRRNTGDESTLFYEDVERIRAHVPMASRVSAAVNVRGANAKYGSNVKRTTVNGVESDMKYIRNATRMHSGRWFTDEEDRELALVAVLGYAVYEELFGTEHAIGANIRIEGLNFEVIGVVDFKGGSGWMNPDDTIYLPFRTAQKRLTGRDRVDFISVMAASSEFLPITEEDIRLTLGETRRNASGEEMFRVFNQAEDLEAIQEQSALLGGLLAGIASVSLLVGGIGIMNIMLVSVTERTREIGLRKAIGAKRGTILWQFLFESVVMCVLGGAIGVMVGRFATQFVAGKLGVPPVMSANAVIAAFLFSTFVGLFFGLYPAIRASRLLPIEALRYE